MRRVALALALLSAACSTGGGHVRVVAVKLGQYKLAAVLTLPAGSKPAPVIVMMGGSGPTDADETIGVQKPFRDIADGLAKQGVATLRYPKATVRALTTPRLTPTIEYEPDARAAVDLLAKRSDIDASRIYLLGHSLGGTMAPRVATDEPRFRGVILMAALAENFVAALLRQVRTISPDNPQTLAAADDLRRQVADPGLTPDTKITGPFAGGTTGAYFLDLRGYDAVATARALPQPLLLLQGDRDYQVTVADDLLRWIAGLTGKSDVTIKRYPDATHAFVDGTGTPTPANYSVPGHVDPQVILDIAAWVKTH